jgi:four helix bundle protein
MARDHRKLRVFSASDALVLDVYRATNGFPVEERYGLQTQLRRAAVSAASNIVEGSARRTTREYAHFLNVSVGSAAEAEYLLDVSYRLGYLSSSEQSSLSARYREVLRGLQSLIYALQSLANQGGRPFEAHSQGPEARRPRSREPGA